MIRGARARTRQLVARSSGRSMRRTMQSSLAGRLRRIGIVVCALLLVALPVIGQSTRASTRAVIISIHGEINDILAGSIERRLDEARADGIKTIIFEMDTPGGLVTSALDICTMIKNLPPDVHTVAWVNSEAYSAGAMISVACRQIVMSPASKIGDCAPIMVTPTGGLQELPATERAKIESPILQEFRDSAQRNGYDPLLCRAMVSAGEEVWWIENVETGQRRFVDAAEKKRLIGEVDTWSLFDKPEGGEESGEPARKPAPGNWRLVKTFVNPLSGEPADVPQPIDRADTLLTLSQSEAVAYGLATAIVADENALAARLDLAAPATRSDVTGWEIFVIWLNRPLIRGILFVIVLLGGYIEFQNPGLILPGATAAVALLIFLGAPYAAGLATIWTLVLLVLGLILLAVEVFVLPGFGIAGISGIVLILIAVIGTFVPAEPDMPAFSLPTLAGTWTALKTGIVVVSSSLVIAVIGIMLLARYVGELPGARRLMLSTPDGSELALHDPYPDVALPGDVGVVVHVLRPGGQARFGDRIVDVQSEGEYVDKGRRVRVSRREGPTIIVHALAEDAQA